MVYRRTFVATIKNLPFICNLNNKSLIETDCGLSSLRQSLTTESPLKLMEHAFYLTLKALLVLMIFKFLS